MIKRSLTARFLALSLLFTAALCSSARATAFRINSSADAPDAYPGDGICADNDGHCTIRAALMEAALTPTDSIVISDTIGVIYLRLGSLTVTAPNLTIVGGGEPTVIDGSLNAEGTDLLIVSGFNCRISSVQIVHSRRHGIRVRAAGCRIGDTSNTTIVASNGNSDTLSAGICVDNLFPANAEILNVWVGVAGNGTLAQGNQTGIWIRGSSEVKIGDGFSATRNVIAGNYKDGILIDNGSEDVTIQGSTIGLDVTGRTPAPNERDGIRIAGGSQNVVIGGTSAPERNIISENRQNGISIVGQGTRDNQIAANYVGLDSSGFFDAGNLGAGISVSDGASHNQIGKDSIGPTQRLVIAGSRGNGIEIRGIGTDSNMVDWTMIGTDSRGDSDRPNGQDHGQGVEISGGAKYNRIGSDDPWPRNIIDGNYGPGVAIFGKGTDSNILLGNFVGVYRLGNAPFGNSAGVVIRDSARFNIIGGPNGSNLISGNRGDLFPLGAGVVLFGEQTDFNLVQNNLIGTDYTGTRAIRNLSAGIVIGGGASRNIIGGDTATGNQISGNGTLPLTKSLAAGIHIFGEGTDSNVVAGNLIGVAADGATPLGNNGHGVGVYAGVSGTIVGGDSPSARNIIARNKYAAVWIDGAGTDRNFVRYNSIASNDSGGIVLAGGANGGLVRPYIIGADSSSVWGAAEIDATIDLYAAQMSPTGVVQGIRLVGTTTARFDGLFLCPFSGLPPESSVTAVQSLQALGSSPFSPSRAVPQQAPQANDSIVTPHTVLYQNIPNPFNSNTIISFEISHADSPQLEIFNIAGQRVRLIATQLLPPGNHSVDWDGTNDNGEVVSSGAYFYRLTTSDGVSTKKMVLLK